MTSKITVFSYFSNDSKHLGYAWFIKKCRAMKNESPCILNASIKLIDTLVLLTLDTYSYWSSTKFSKDSVSVSSTPNKRVRLCGVPPSVRKM